MGQRAQQERRYTPLLASLEGEFDRRRHQRNPAQYRRQAHSKATRRMSLLTDDQKMLHETAASFLAEEGSISKQLRHWRDIACKDGFGHGLWKQFADLGLTGICIPESHGGLGLGVSEAALVLEEIG